ncbi:hypothetical protein VNO78_11253 [Psophocarpus tetragonolobus]|uniref:Uncharacterized protein n=1 Tax=Psophocarpus tetragonolobus TaxID=3891 RepID=A0AAN9STA1_PSOTE
MQDKGERELKLKLNLGRVRPNNMGRAGQAQGVHMPLNLSRNTNKATIFVYSVPSFREGVVGSNSKGDTFLVQRQGAMVDESHLKNMGGLSNDEKFF